MYCVLYSFGASADRCIQNIYRKLRQETDSPKKYPGVLASLLMLDKLSIEDIKASVTELMAGGVDTVRKTFQNIFFFFFQEVIYFFSFLYIKKVVLQLYYKFSDISCLNMHTR